MSSYSSVQKLLHRIVLGHPFIVKSLFEFEKTLFKSKAELVNDNRHAFITGLPRSGTTALLNYLYNTNQFASLTYGDMPFVMAPNLFAKNNKRYGNIVFKERLHKDGLYYDLGTPEAFDEVIFQNFDETEINEVLPAFLSLVTAKYRKKRYLSKNNCNYSRLILIQSLFPNALIFLAFRDPLQQAASLLRQHISFCTLQKNDPFILEYMNFLGHKEFGLGYISWNRPIKHLNPQELDHWLEQWLLFYKSILEGYSNYKNVKLVCYEKLCGDKFYFQNLLNEADLSCDIERVFFNLSHSSIDFPFDDQLWRECLSLYEHLTSLSLK